MNPSPSRHDPAVDEQAATWAARLDGDVLDASSRASLDAWLAESPAHRAALADYCQFSADLEEQLPVLVSTGAVKMPEPTTVRRRLWTMPRLAVLSLAATAAAIAFMTWTGQPSPQVQNVATAVAQRLTHTLADGTRVELNAHTSLRFENSAHERRVRLAGGEALFAVAKDRSRPFIVETLDGSVRVTGTTFNVRNETGSATTLEVTVVEGSVEVRPGDGGAGQPPFSLAAGDQLSAGPGGVSRRPLDASALSDALAWREGRIVFNDVPLQEVAARLSRFHGRRITVDPAIAGEKVGGVYQLDDFKDFLAALEVALPVKTHDELSGAVSIGPRSR